MTAPFSHEPQTVTTVAILLPLPASLRLGRNISVKSIAPNTLLAAGGKFTGPGPAR